MKIIREQCPRCHNIGKDRTGDNLARYSDGTGYCFSCGFFDRPQYLIKPKEKQQQVLTYYGNLERVPRESVGYAWLKQYDLTDNEIDTYYQWNEIKQQLVFVKTLTSIEEYVSIRSFSYGKPKALSYGKKPYQVLRQHKNKPIVLVEDLVSAIKVSRHYNAVSLFGTTCPKEALESLLSVSKHLYIWLDRDALEKALKIRSDAFKQDFIIASLIRTELDPKNYSDNEIINILNKKG